MKSPVALGKLVMSVLRIALTTVAALGALILVFGAIVRQPNTGRYSFPAGPRADAEALRKHVEFLTIEAFPRNTRHPEQLDRAADYLLAEFSRTGARVTEQTYSAGRTRCRNIVARFGPPSGRLLVIGAHYDVFGDLPGADDNASGAAALIELARLLGARVVSSPVEVVAFSTEEPPFFGGPEMGSAVHARSLRSSGTAVIGMICLEMIGFYSAEQPNQNLLLHLVYPRTGDFVCAGGRWRDRWLVREIKKSFRGATQVPAYSYTGPIVIGTDLSDHRNYWREGYAAVMITDTAHLRNPNYHSFSDTAETLDYRRMAGVVDGVVSAVMRLTRP